MKIKKSILFIPIIGLLYILLLNQFGGILKEERRLEIFGYIYQISSLLIPLIVRQFFYIL